MQKALWFGVAALVVLTSAAAPAMAASVSELTLINDAHVRPQEARSAEHAVRIQVNTQVRRYWHVPRIRWGRHGIPVYLDRSPEFIAQSPCFAARGWVGCHVTFTARRSSFLRAAAAYIEIDTAADWTITLSHEVIEMLIDPSGRGYEPCDPVEDESYDVHGIAVSDFMLPNRRTDWLSR